MRSITTTAILLTIIVVIFAASAFAQDANKAATPGKAIEVQRFAVEKAVVLPDKALDGMMNDIVSELTKLKKFNSVRLAAPAGSPAPAIAVEPDLELTGTVTRYDAGSRATRYLIGFGAGKTKIVATMKLVEKASGKVLIEKRVDGSVNMGLFGGSSGGAFSDLAEEVAKTTKKAVFGK